MRQSRLVILSVLVGLIAVVLATYWLRSEREAVQIVVAASPIKAGSRLTQDNLGYSKVPKEEMAQDAIINRDPLMGRFTKFDIAAGDGIKERLLVPMGATSGLAAAITPGRRAFAIRVNEVAGVAGFALPGNYVDVLLSTKDSSGQPSSKVLLERVLILAVAQEQSVSGDSKPKVVDVVTLEVSPQQAEVLDMARLVGGLSLALRNQNDDTSEKTLGARRGDINGSRPTIEVIRGTDRVLGSGLNNY
jgi:pilus assembly protein CpaB